jgi:hypothetical protein
MATRKKPEPQKSAEGAQASETDQLEGALAASQTEGAGDPPPVQADAQADQAETPPEKPVVNDTAAGTDEEPTKTASPVKPSDTLKETLQGKDKARQAAIKDAQDQLPEAEDITEEEAAEFERKDKIQAKLIEADAEIQKLQANINKRKELIKKLMADLYPHSVENDRHVDAVRGFLKASQEERRTRGAHPARLKELLERAGKAPIDAAFQRSRARGHARPTRSPVNAGGAPAGDQANKATPGAKE